MHHMKLTKCQILALTVNNATNMDTLSDNLEEQVPLYSWVNRTRCFTHILNLVAKSLLQQFNVTPDLKGPNDDDGDARKWGLVKELSNTLRVMWHNKQHNSHTHCSPLSLYPSSFMLVFQSFRFWRMGWNSSHVEHPTLLLSSWPCPTSIKTSWNKLSQPAKCTPPFDTHLPLQRRCLIAITH